MLILILIAATVFLSYMAYKTTKGLSGYALAAIIVGVFTAMALVCVPLGHMFDSAFIQQMKATQNTIDVSRAHNTMTEYERAAITSKIIEMNADLVERQYMRRTLLFSAFHSPEIEYCQPLQ